MEERKKVIPKGFKQMIISIDPSILVDIKARALFKNISLKQWVLQAIDQARYVEDKVK